MNQSAQFPVKFQTLALLIPGLILVVDALLLMMYGTVNLGVGLPLVIGLALIALAWKWSAVQNWRACKRWHQLVWKTAWTGFALWLASVGLFFYFISHDHNVLANTDKIKAIMILGAGIPDCRISPTLSERLHLGLTWAQRLPDARVLVTGGVEWNGQCSEGQVMGDYLRAHGLAPQRILQEEHSTTTYENFSMSLPLLQANGIQASDTILIVSSDFHSVRSRHIASKLGYQAIAVSGALTPLYVRYNAWLREYFSFIKAWALGQY
jgi:uncharacterized SAM-binding protein YcdF (DUF218 family)